MEEEKIKENDNQMVEEETTEVQESKVEDDKDTVKKKKQASEDVEFKDHELSQIFDMIRNVNNQELLQTYNMAKEHIEYLKKEKEKVLEDDKK